MDQDSLAQLPVEALVETDVEELLTQRKLRDDYQKLISAIDLLGEFQRFTSDLQLPHNNLPAKSVWRDMLQYEQSYFRSLAKFQGKWSHPKELKALHNKYQELLTIVHGMDEAQYRSLRSYVEGKVDLKYGDDYPSHLGNEWLKRKAGLEEEHYLASAMDMEWVSYVEMPNEQKFIIFPLLYTLDRMDWSQFQPIFLHIAGCLVKARGPTDEGATNNGLSLLLRQIIPMLLITRLFSRGVKEASAILNSLGKIPAPAEGPVKSAIGTWEPAYRKFINFLAPQFHNRWNRMAFTFPLSRESQMAYEYLSGLNGTVYSIKQGEHGRLPTLHLAIFRQSYQNKAAWAKLLQYQNREPKHQ
ncbi:hypothetical protein IWQ61_010683 [Dispira simplex]|nr:hypothetical protein IWQ61_010683 [Dispira simplex]